MNALRRLSSHPLEHRVEHLSRYHSGINQARIRQIPFPIRSVHQIFDRKTKKWQRDRTINFENPNQYEYLREEIAERLCDRLYDVKRDFKDVLELGCATGLLYEKLKYRKDIKSLLQCDMSSGMIERAKLLAATSLLSHSSLDLVKDSQDRSENEPEINRNIERKFMVLDEEEPFPFQQDSFDLVLSNLNLHWVNDLPGTFIQIKNALRPDGVFIASMFGGDTLHELRVSMQLAEEELWGGVSPHVSPLVQVKDVGSVLARGGFGVTTVDVDTVQIPYPDMMTLMKHLQGMGESNAVCDRRVHFGKQAFQKAAEIYQSRFSFPDGNIKATFQIVFMIGWKPHESQPKPKARGSATFSLKDLQRDLGKSQ